MSKKLSLLLAVLVWAGHCVRAEGPQSPFGVIASRLAGDASGVRFSFEIPKDCVLYSDHLFFETGLGENLNPVNIPAPIMDVDKASGEERKMYDRSFTADLLLPADFAGDGIEHEAGAAQGIHAEDAIHGLVLKAPDHGALQIQADGHHVFPHHACEFEALDNEAMKYAD